ncbi:MAG TPA: O-antigen ligase family protein [Planctomycetota bacterium]|nr:O-antigen ligase family protein [Planctomycetota bacterium]
MTRWVFLLLPVAGILACDPAGGLDDFAPKYVALALAAFACVACSLEARRLAWSKASAALWIFVAVRGMMLLRSPVPPHVLRDWLLLVALALAHHAACAAVPRGFLRNRVPPVLGGLGAALGLFALGQRITGTPQAYATFANPNFLGAGLAMLLPYALASRGRWRFALAGACLLGLLVTKSRGGALAAGVAVAVLLSYALPRARWVALAGVPAGVLLFAVLLGKSETVEVRLTWYRAAFAMGLEHPLLGLGSDGFAREYPPVRPQREWEIHQGRAVPAVHDDYLESFAEGGLLGLGAHLLLFGAAAWALRRQRAALASLAAFAAESHVDMPLRDPSLLALALLPLAFAERRSTRRGVLPATLLALLAIGFAIPLDIDHWRADRALGRFLRTRDRAHLDASLALEPRNPDALISRSRPEDLALLLEMEPHNGGALFNRAVRLPPEEAVPALEEILEKHDPHHRLTRMRLRKLRDLEAERRAREIEPLIATDPLKALSLLEAVVRDKPGSPGPYLILARLHRREGDADAVDRWLREAEARGATEEIADERLSFERDELAAGSANLPGIRRAAAMLAPDALRARIDARLAAARAVEEASPPPALAPTEREDPAAYAKRQMKARADWRAELQLETRPDYVIARVLAEELAQREPSARHMHLLATAVRGQGEVQRAAQLEAVALFLETLEALAQGDEALARRRYERALRAYPELAGERTVQEAWKLFVAGNEERRRQAASLGILR